VLSIAVSFGIAFLLCLEENPTPVPQSISLPAINFKCSAPISELSSQNFPERGHYILRNASQVNLSLLYFAVYPLGFGKIDLTPRALLLNTDVRLDHHLIWGSKFATKLEHSPRGEIHGYPSPEVGGSFVRPRRRHFPLSSSGICTHPSALGSRVGKVVPPRHRQEDVPSGFSSLDPKEPVRTPQRTCWEFATLSEISRLRKPPRRVVPPRRSQGTENLKISLSRELSNSRGWVGFSLRLVSPNDEA